MIVVFSKKTLGIAGVIAVIAVLFFTFGRKRTEYVVVERAPISATTQIPAVLPTTLTDSSSSTVISALPVLANPLTAEPCNNALRRPIAVMLSGDTIARPLSGIAEADMVFEMPVITNTISASAMPDNGR